MTIDRCTFSRTCNKQTCNRSTCNPNHYMHMRMLLKAAMDMLLAAVAVTVEPSRPVAEVLSTVSIWTKVLGFGQFTISQHAVSWAHWSAPNGHGPRGRMHGGGVQLR